MVGDEESVEYSEGRCGEREKVRESERERERDRERERERERLGLSPHAPTPSQFKRHRKFVRSMEHKGS